MRLNLLVMLMASAALVASAQREVDSSGKAKGVPQAKIGGVELLLPNPDGDFTEVGDRLRTTVFELLAPSTNRLLTAYVSSKTQQNLLSGNATGGLGTYGMVEVPRRAEYADLTSQAFDELANNVAASLGVVTAKVTIDAEDEINVRLKALGGKPLGIDRPEMVGVLFRKTDAFGWAMLMGVKGGDNDARAAVAMASALIRVKQRAVFVYVYRPYESPETIDYLRKLIDSWMDRILTVNK
jgi:hypothetical protein